MSAPLLGYVFDGNAKAIRLISGVPGAAEHLTLLNEDETKRAAVTRLSELYHDDGLMESIPVEL